jgi:hypothetical protein
MISFSMALRHSMRRALAKKDDFGKALVRGGYHRPLGADAYTSHGRGSGRLEESEVYRVTIL